jgi:hypothetical protein
MVSGAAIIRLTRFCPRYRDMFGGYRFYCDGERIGEAPRQEPTEFSVPPGSHVLQVRGKRFLGEPSNEIEIDLEPGSLRIFECRTKSRLLGLTDKEAQAIERRKFNWVRLYEVPPAETAPSPYQAIK